MVHIRRKPVQSAAAAAAVTSEATPVRRKPVNSAQYRVVVTRDDDEDEQDAQAINHEPRQPTHGQQTGERKSLIEEHDVQIVDNQHRRSSSLQEPNAEGDVGPKLTYSPSPVPGAGQKSPRVVEFSYSNSPTTSLWSDDSRPRMWNPIWLRKTVLAAFAACFVCMLLATALLYHFSLQNNGLGTQDEAHHYAWKYGPTAILVMVSAMWRQVDYSNKVSMPWKELRAGPNDVHKTLLLDYVTPLVTTSLWAAIRNRHWAVVASIAGWGLIVLTTVFSTGLLILEETVMTQDNTGISMKTEFNADDFDFSTIGAGPAQVYYGVNFNNLTYPPGTSNDLVVPELEFSARGMAAANYTATLPGANVDMSCEVLPNRNATRVTLPYYSILGGFWVMNVTHPECNLTNTIVAAGPTHNTYVKPNSTQNYQGFYQDYVCNNGVDWSGPITRPTTQLRAYSDEQLTNTSMPHRMLFTMVKLRFPPKIPMMSAPPAYMYIEKMTAVLCKYDYIMSTYEVRSSTDGSQEVVRKNDSSGETANSIPGFPGAYLGLAVGSSARQMDLGEGGVDYVLSEPVQSFFTMMKMKLGLDSISAFMDPDLLISTATEVFKGVGTQVLAQSVLRPANTTTLGSVTFVENRLQVKLLSTALMCSFLGILAIISAWMIFIRPRNVAPREPGSIAATATVLAASPRLRKLLSGLGSARRSLIRKELSGYSYRGSLHPGPETTFVIEPTQGKAEPDKKNDPLAPALTKWWRPLAGQAWFLALSVILPLIIIALLEVLQRMSNDRDGFVDITSKTSTALATYIPAAVAVVLSGLYSSFGAMTAIFAPFDALKKRNAVASRSVSLNLVGKLPPHAILDSITARHFGVVLILLANVVASFLTMVVSGLYSASTVDRTSLVELQQLDVFDFEQQNLWVDDNQATVITSLMEYVDLPHPQWTFDDVVINAFAPLNLSGAVGQAPISATVPGIRGNLNCSVIPSNERILGEYNLPSTDSIFPKRDLPYMAFGTNDLPSLKTDSATVYTNQSWICDRPPAGNLTKNAFMQTYPVRADGRPFYAGAGSIMSWSYPADSKQIYANGVANARPIAGQGFPQDGIDLGGYGCPTFLVTLGTAKVTLKNTTRIRNSTRTRKTYDYESDLATVMCRQNLEEVMVNVTFNADDMTFSKTHPPAVDESSKRLLRSPATGTTTFEFSLNRFLLTLPRQLVNTIPGPDGGFPSEEYLHTDAFVRMLVTGKRKLPITQLAGDGNVENLMKAANGVYKTYISQTISANMRNATTDTGSRLPTYQATVVTPGTPRLRQNEGSKIALQAMLGVMVVCIVASRLLIDVHEVVPHDPCSIAGTASMLADSEMATRKIVPEGAEWRSDAELERAGVFEAYRYRLGWWEREGGVRFGIDIEEKEKSREG
ncbi:hypothetical protein C8035_v011871 [Colletotrichum spinosum]|uniref:Uncharacterized protein n=1 Tax=Colletotrichum spinosum TaxID=1347390 RepID=A0A4R8Q4P6_9PEZI|nr:hypothetical protein C8035_v011871 [Colletotrichum spinosum]